MLTMDCKKAFGASVRAWRHQLAISQEELAERASLHRTYVSDVERGTRNVSLEIIQRLAQALEVSISAFFPPAVLQAPATATTAVKPLWDFVDVLLVEDNSDDVALALKAFQKARFANRINVVSDGAAALDYLFRRVEEPAPGIRGNGRLPHVILLDLGLPEITGIEVLRRLKADPRTRGIPVVVLTASQKDQDFAVCEQLGARAYIVKPMDFAALSRTTPLLELDWALLRPSNLNTQLTVT